MTLFSEKKSSFSIPQYPANESKTSMLLEKYYREVPSSIINQIRDLYAIDFEMFGYSKYLSFKERNWQRKSNTILEYVCLVSFDK